jgi:hypothetical protein
MGRQSYSSPSVFPLRKIWCAASMYSIESATRQHPLPERA